ncbi:MAG: hypothetical protein J6I53_09680 [Treponema sp.]|nr:hypothetical protein [Treponema sp.]
MKRFVIFFLTVFFSFSIFAQDLTITKINFDGLKKTRDSYIQSKVSKFIGLPLTDENMHDLETAVQLEGLFDDIHISTEQIGDTDAEINISVKEKITFIPLPFAMASSSGYMAGAVVMDTNAFGRKDNFMIGGFFSNSSMTGMASFSKPAKPNGVPGFSVFVSGGKSHPELVDIEEETILKYKSLGFSASFSIFEKLGENFTISNGYSYRYLSTESVEEYPSFPEEKLHIGSVSLGLGYSRSDWNGVFMSTNSASISAEVGLTNSEDDEYRHPLGASFAIGEQHPVFTPRLRIYQKISGYYGKKNHISAYMSQSAASVNILPGSFVTERIIGGNAGLEIAVAKFSWAMLSIYGDYQLVYTKKNTLLEDDDEYEFMHGPNGGVRFYLSKIAFPALSMGLAYNVTKNYWQFAAAMGMSF